MNVCIVGGGRKMPAGGFAARVLRGPRKGGREEVELFSLTYFRKVQEATSAEPEDLSGSLRCHGCPYVCTRRGLPACDVLGDLHMSA